MVVELLKVQRSVVFKLCLYEKFVEFWRADVLFENPGATIFVDFPPSNIG